METGVADMASKETTKLYAGFDIGSDTVHSIVLDDKGRIVHSPVSLMHFGNPIAALKEAYEDAMRFAGQSGIKAFAFTGSVGKLIAQVTDNPYYFDTISIPAGAEAIAPDADYIIHIGAKDPYFFERESEKGNQGRSFVTDHATGTKCGGGSGILINKQVRRFFTEDVPIKLQVPDSASHKETIQRENRRKMQEQVEAMHQKALKEIIRSNKHLDVGGRCGVIIQSDMIHMQNSGEQIPDILKGMFARIIKNYKCDVIRTRQLAADKRVVATGGIFHNKELVALFSEQLGVKLERPENFEKIGAAGAALRALKENRKSVFHTDNLQSVIEAQKQEVQYAPPLSSALKRVHVYPEEKSIKQTGHGLIIYKGLQESVAVVIGIDGGSTTTKALIADASNMGIIAEICLDTDGKPLETAQKMFGEIREHLGAYLRIKGIAYTGSSGDFYHRLFTDFSKAPGAVDVDLVKDEITCHAFGVKHFNSKVDTIFECGGQDAKFTVFNKDGTVKKAKMNLCCMAGTGQSMKNMLDMLGLDFNTFRDYSLAAKRTPIADEMCAIFTEAGILKLLALGFPKEEIAAATAYGFMGGYANKFVGNETFGQFASAQGGPFKGLGCLAALALHTGAEIHAFPHRQLFGAMGAAIVAYEKLKEIEKAGLKAEVRFRGLNIADMNYEKQVENCSKIIKDSCGLRDCRLQVYRIDKDEIFSGGMCPKGNTETHVKKAPNYVHMYKSMLNVELKKYVKAPSETSDSDSPRVLIPRTLSFLNERGIFYSVLYKSLGYEVVVSPESDDELANEGIAHSHSESCYPAKLQNGHVSYLKKYLRRGKDRILLVNQIGKGKDKQKFCPFIAAAGFVAKEALRLDNREVLLPVIHFNDPNYKIKDAVWRDLKRVYRQSGSKPEFNKSRVRQAVREAEKAQETFQEKIYAKGAQILEKLKEKNQKVFIGVGRGYTVLDDKASSKIHELFSSCGLNFVPAFFMKPPHYDIAEITHHMYWFQARTLLRYALMTAMDPLLYGVRETNFGCGADSMLLYHEQRIMDEARKPYLVLQTDGHNSNAQFGTRTLANNEVVKTHKPEETLKLKNFVVVKPPEDDLHSRVMGIPDMGRESSEMLGAIFKSIGYKTEVMASKTESSKYYARKFLVTNNCCPFTFLVGDSLAWIFEKQMQGMDPNKELAILMPQSGGPCRLGQYHVITRFFLDSLGFTQVPVIAPASYKDWENIPVPSRLRAILRKSLAKSLVSNDTIQNALLRTRPYEKNKGETDRVYAALHKELLGIIERKANIGELEKFMQKAVEEFKCIPTSGKRLPKVIMCGEIFVRCHPLSNQNSVRMLEANNLEVFLPLVADMIKYVNSIQRKKFFKDKKFKEFLRTFLKGMYMNSVEKRLFKPFEEYLSDRKPQNPIALVRQLQEDTIYHVDIEGESGLSIGEAYEFMNGHSEGTCGIYHVGPFGCMHETVATSKIQSLINKKRSEEENIAERIIPYLTGVFGESELPNLEAEMAMFSQKCHTRKELHSKD